MVTGTLAYFTDAGMASYYRFETDSYGVFNLGAGMGDFGQYTLHRATATVTGFTAITTGGGQRAIVADVHVVISGNAYNPAPQRMTRP